MNPIMELNENTEDLARLALRAAVDIDRFQRGKIDSLESVERLRKELIQSSGLVSHNGSVSFSGDAATANLIGAALYNLPEASGQKIDELATVFNKMMDAASGYSTKRDDLVLTQLRDFCLLLNQEAVRARYIYDLDDVESSDERRIH